jgi:hypothetical protein
VVRELESLAFEKTSQALFFVGGEMQWRGIFVGMQGLTLDVLAMSDTFFSPKEIRNGINGIAILRA